MEFVYDKLQAGAEGTPEPSEEKPRTSIDTAADKLENVLEKRLEKVSDSQSWSSWWSSIKEKGTAAIQEVENFTSELGQENSQPQQQRDVSTSSSDSNLANSTDTVKPGDGGEKADDGTMMDELSKRAQVYIDNLDKDLEKIEIAAGSYLSKFGKDFKSIVKEAITVAAPNDTSYDRQTKSPSISSNDGEDLPSEVLFNVPEDIRNQIYSTRLDAQLHALHTSAEPFLTTTKEDGFDDFSTSFDVSLHTDEIAKDLDKYAQLRSLMESLVPEKISYDQFWTKYYYMRKQLAEQEKKRKMLLEKATHDESADISWDDEDDDENETQTPKPKDNEPSSKTASSRPSSEESYDLVSKNSSTADLKPKQTPNNSKDDEDDDDDWE
jgi:hypothetical protein